jgi:hypothetical protein
VKFDRLRLAENMHTSFGKNAMRTEAERAREAYDRMVSGKARFRAVLTMG